MSNETYHFSFAKEICLIKDRGLSFKKVITAIENGKLLDILPHPNADKYPPQFIYVVNLDGYAHVVPFVRCSEHKVFLKTIFPHRKLTKYYRERGLL